MKQFLRPDYIFIMLFLGLCSPSLWAQKNELSKTIDQLKSSGATFIRVDQLFEANLPPKYPQNELDRMSQRLLLNTVKLQDIVNARPEAITLILPYRDTSLTIELYEQPILSSDFRVTTSENQSVMVNKGVFYRGIIQGDEQSVAAISFFDNEVIGIISNPTFGNLNLGRMEVEGNTRNYVLFPERLLPEMPFNDCRTPDAPKDGEAPRRLDPSEVQIAGCVTIFFEGDYQLYQEKGSVQNVVNYIAGFFNAVSTIYANETISIAISQIFVWTTPDAYSSTSSHDALEQFAALRTSFTGRLAHLVSRSGGSAGLGGVAYINVLCSNSFNYAYSGISGSYNAYPTYSWTVNVVAHEMGHNFGSNHTHWCGWSGGAIDNCGPTAGYDFETPPSCSSAPTPPAGGGTIMSYCHLVGGVGITLSNGFGTLPGNYIRTATTNALNSACITSSCPSYSCDAPTNFNIASVSSTSATTSWTAVSGATSYTIQYRQTIGSGAWTTVSGILTTSYIINGLSPATEYEVQVKATCSGGDSRYATGIIFISGLSACPEPSALSAIALNHNQASISWTQPGGSVTSWDIQYGAYGFTLGSGTTINTTTQPYILSALSGTTTYQCYIRANCSGGNGSSTWVGPTTFTLYDFSAGAVTLTVNTTCTGNIYSNATHTTESGEFSPTYNNFGDWYSDISHTAWFKFVAPASGSVKISTDFSNQGTLTDTQVALYSSVAPTNATQLLASNEDGGQYGSGYNTRIYYSGLTPGSTYYIQVDGWGTDVGTFCIEVQETFELPAPASCTTYAEEDINGSTAPNKWFNIYTRPSNGNIGVPVAAVRTALNLGTVSVSLIANTSVPASSSGVKYMQRYYNFSSTLNETGSKDIRLFFTNTELSNYKTATSLPSFTADDLNISHYDGTNEDCTPNNNNNNNFTTIPNTSISSTQIGSSGYFYLQFPSASFSEMGAMFYNSLLPVELIAFNGRTQGNSNYLYWTTAIERAVKLFRMERSSYGTGGWSSIGETLPQNNEGQGQQNYSMIDPRPLSKGFYRLVTVNLDGSEEYSNIIVLSREKSRGIQEITPNPANDNIQISYIATEEETVQFRFYSTDGRLILDQKIQLREGLNMFPFDISDLPTGVYYCTTHQGQSVRFVKQ